LERKERLQKDLDLGLKIFHTSETEEIPGQEQVHFKKEQIPSFAEFAEKVFLGLTGINSIKDLAVIHRRPTPGLQEFPSVHCDFPWNGIFSMLVFEEYSCDSDGDRT